MAGNQASTHTPTSQTLPPHKVIPGYYASPEERQEVVNGLFNDVARHYDRITTLMSFGTGMPYRRSVLKRIGVGPGAKVLDVACGTGQVAAAALQLVGPSGTVIGIDPSEGMRRIAEERRAIRTLPGTSDNLPVESGTYDFVVMGYALRHVSDLISAFTEMRRVLKPGGQVLILEITAPQNPLARFLLKLYLKGIVPAASLLVTGSRPAMRLMTYYWETIQECVRPASILDAMARAGLEHPTRQTTLGIFNEYIAHVPAPGTGLSAHASDPSPAAGPEDVSHRDDRMDTNAT